MSADELRHENEIDKVLKGALRSYQEPVRRDFTDHVLKQVQAFDEQKILAKVVLQERLALAACIIVPVAAAAAIFAYPQILTTSWIGLKDMFYAIAKQIALIPQYSWQTWAVFMVVLGFAGYSALDLLFADR